MVVITGVMGPDQKQGAESYLNEAVLIMSSRSLLSVWPLTAPSFCQLTHSQKSVYTFTLTYMHTVSKKSYCSAILIEKWKGWDIYFTCVLQRNSIALWTQRQREAPILPLKFSFSSFAFFILSNTFFFFFFYCRNIFFAVFFLIFFSFFFLFNFLASFLSFMLPLCYICYSFILDTVVDDLKNLEKQVMGGVDKMLRFRLRTGSHFRLGSTSHY